MRLLGFSPSLLVLLAVAALLVVLVVRLRVALLKAALGPVSLHSRSWN